MARENSSARSLWLLLGLFALIGIGAFFIPGFIIRPFAYQSPKGLYWAMAIRHHAPLVSVIAWIACVGLALVLWTNCGRWAKVALGSVLTLVTFSAVMSRLNYFEWMFHPVQSAQFDAESASKLADAEMILAVKFGADARAYPIREMAYHHILNDVVEGIPIAVTY